MATMCDTLVKAIGDHWDAAIIAKPTTISKLLDPTKPWWPDPRQIISDAVIVYPYQNRVPLVIGTDGAGHDAVREWWLFEVVISTPGKEIAADGHTNEDRLKLLYDGTEDALIEENKSGPPYWRIDSARDTTDKRARPLVWKIDAIVRGLEPSRVLST